ncbi:MAG: YlbF family regulator [Eubacterium sp.]|nr:YlbF family regulator [Eubacterium sp.]
MSYLNFEDACRDFENSPVLKDYISATAEIEKDRELFAKMREFKNLHVKLHEKEKNGENDFGMRHHASTVYYDLLRIPTCEKFLKAEQRLLNQLKFYDTIINDSLKKNGILGFGGDEL